MTEHGELQQECDHAGEPEFVTFTEYLRMHPSEAERIKALGDSRGLLTLPFAEILRSRL